MTERVKGFRYILVVINRFSRWIEAIPTKGPDCRSVAKFLCKEVFPRFGIPDTISSDNGPSFVAETLKIALKMLGIKQKFGCVYHPQSQGAVERANGTLKTKLRKIMADSQYKVNWVDALPLTLMSMRTQANRLTHLTPHEALTGRPMPVPYRRGPYEGPPLEQCERELTCYLQHLTQIHKVVFQQIKTVAESKDVEIPEQLRTVEPGDWVYVKVFKRKWDQPRREGPFKVILATPTALKVEGKRFWFHLNHCCRARSRQEPERDGNASRQEERQQCGPQGERRSQRLAARRRESVSSGRRDS
ncbi:protein NYNRIN-like [Thunnus albacares]|uniref:protein NYNRIN-like n=1 Tax=Thunnus albacares TaxID=8236 RepID=UPI001CF6DBB1|nr:protein NYNRIN-like [Thunnus albacares]